MKAVVITRPGGPEVLSIREMPEPEVGPEEVRVAVRATALNRADVLQRLGRYPAPPGSPADVPGLEFAGEVETCGGRAQRFRPGNRVMGIVGGGGHAEKVVVHERVCLPVPPSLGFEEAAAVPEAFLTAYDALYLRGRLEPGEVVLITAAGSGVGTAAVEIAAVAGARVVALSRTEEKRRRLEGLGAEAALDPEAADILERVRSLSGDGGADLALDLVGAAGWDLLMEALAPRGRLVLVGTLGGARVEADLSVLMRKRLTVVGTVLRTRPLEEKIALVQAFSRGMLPLLAAGRLRPVVDRVLPLGEVALAHELLERNATFGKIVLRVR